MSAATDRTYSKEIAFGFLVLAFAFGVQFLMPQKEVPRAPVPTPEVPTVRATPQKRELRGLDLGKAFDIAGIQFPAFTDQPRDLRDFRAADFLSEVVVPSPLPKLSHDQKSWLRKEILQICSIENSVIQEDRTFPTALPIWHAVTSYYPSIFKVKTSTPLVSDGQVSMLALEDALLKNLD